MLGVRFTGAGGAGGKERARVTPPGSLALWPAAAAAALFLASGSRLAAVGALDHHEAGHASATLCMIDSNASPGLSAWPTLPWMLTSYNGALKSYLLYVPFRLWGVEVRTLRAVTIGIGALAVFFLALIVGERLGAGPAAAASLFFATDPAPILWACRDTGPQILILLFQSGGLLCWLRSLERERRDRLAFLAGLFWGLALWDKAHFAWFLAAFAATSWIFPGRRRWGVREFAAAAAGLAAGALPLLIHNAAAQFGTLFEFGRVAGLHDNLPHAGSDFYSRLNAAQTALTGARHMTAQGVAVGSDWRLPGLGILVMAGAAARRRDWNCLREAAFWLALASGILLLAITSPLPVKPHHMLLLYPLPHLALIGLLAPAARRWRPLRGAVLLVVALAAGSNALTVLVRIPEAISMSGGYEQAHATIVDAATWIENHRRRAPGDDFLVDSRLDMRLRFYTKGRIPWLMITPEQEIGRITAVVMERVASAPRHVAVIRLSPDGSLPASFQAALRRLAIEPQPLGRVNRQDGGAWIGFFSLGPPGLDEAIPDPEWRRVIAGIAGHSPRQAGQLLAYLLFHPESALTWLEMSSTARSLNQTAAARRALARAEGLPLDPKERHRVALMRHALGQTEAAVGILTRLISRGPAGAELYADRGVFRELLGERGRAIEDFRRALALDPRCLPAALSLGAILSGSQRKDEARRVYDEALEAVEGTSPPLLSELKRVRARMSRE